MPRSSESEPGLPHLLYPWGLVSESLCNMHRLSRFRETDGELGGCYIHHKNRPTDTVPWLESRAQTMPHTKTILNRPFFLFGCSMCVCVSP